MTRNEFDSLPAHEQWQWVIGNKEKVTLIELDNDVTYVYSDCLNENEDMEQTSYATMKSYIGDCKGVFDLLNALKIKVQGV